MHWAFWCNLYYYLVASFKKKGNNVCPARNDAHGTFFSIAPILDCVHQFGTMALSLEIWVDGNGAYLHHAIMRYRPDAAQDLE